MEVTEYRKNNPNCKYCQHNGGYCGNSDLFPFCEARKKYIIKNQAKKCPVYNASIYSTEIIRIRME